MSLTPIQDAIIPVFIVYETIDEWGRKGGQVGVYRSRSDADRGAKRQGWYGSDGKVEHRLAVQDGDYLYVLEGMYPTQFKDVLDRIEEERVAKVATILAKLTDDEIALLKGEFK